MRGLFYGIGAAVIAIIGRSAYKLVKSTLSKDWLLWTIFAASAVVTARRDRQFGQAQPSGITVMCRVLAPRRLPVLRTSRDGR